MSEEFRKSVLNRVPPLPPTRAPWAEANEADDEEEEEMEEGLGEMAQLGASLPGTSKRSTRTPQDLSPISASGYFAQALEIDPPGRDTVFRTYHTPPSPPAPPKSGNSGSRQGQGGSGNGTLLICHHGAGASGLSFAALAKAVRDRDAQLGVLAYDARGHGKSTTRPPSNEHDLSLQNLLDDLLGVVTHLYPESGSAPALLLMGHSMGAAPILRAAPILQQRGYKITGVIVLDVVEGTAVESLPLMPSILAKRPKSFQSVIDGIHWHISSNSIRNSTSARLSVPSYLVPTSPGSTTQKWRADLLITEPFWREWWSGLSSRFLETKSARLLVLAGQERLDKDLMVGQMQGKFQLEVMQDVGHYLHEDDPDRLAKVVIAFWKRNTQLLVLPPKVGEAWGGQTRKVVEVKGVGQ